MKTRGRSEICSLFLSSPDASVREAVRLHHAVTGGQGEVAVGRDESSQLCAGDLQAHSERT